MRAGRDADLGGVRGIELGGVDTVDRELKSILIGVVTSGGCRDDQCPGHGVGTRGRRAAGIVTGRQRKSDRQEEERVYPHRVCPGR